MTLDEKISQMQNDAPAINRLNVQKYNWWNECLHGVARAGVATVFPQSIGMAATWDPDLIHEEAKEISTEARAKYNYAKSSGLHNIYQGLTFWSPNINIFRDPRWGRGQETYGEDPLLTSRIGVAFVKGLQGDNQKYFEVISTPKHFAVHSGPEPERHSFNAVPSKRDLFETYLPAFEACIEEGGAYSVMAAYNSLYGFPCTASKFLLTDLLRNKWGFKGYVVSDCGAISDIVNGHKYAPDEATASALALKAGCDLTCGCEYSSLKDALTKGLITEKDIDRAVTSLMLARMRLGMFDPPNAVPFSSLTISDNDTPEHRALARKVADESVVLLKNAAKTLPLKKEMGSVTVIGLYADDPNVLVGNYNGTPSKPVTILQGIKNKLSKNVRVSFSAGYSLLVQDNSWDTVPGESVRPSYGAAGHGLFTEYFDNSGFVGKPRLTRVDTSFQLVRGLGMPDSELANHYSSVKWTGTITPPVTGVYEMELTGGGRSRISINDSLIVDNWKLNPIAVFTPHPVFMEKGKEYKIEINYSKLGNQAGIDLKWRQVDVVRDQKMIADAISAAKLSDAVIVVAGISPQLEGEETSIDLPGFKGGDRTSLDIPANQERLLHALQPTGKPIVLVLVGGSALSINWEEKNLPAIIDAWYPGEEGGNSVADVIFGDYNPAGRLPVTFYKSVKDLPPFDDYNMSPDSLGQGRTYRYFKGSPLYPFGFGLSYTQFKYSNLRVNKDTVVHDDTLHVSFSIKNAGELDGDEVVQLYVKSLSSEKPQPIKSLKAFRRIHIDKGDSLEMIIPLPVESLKYFDEEKNDFAVEPGRYELLIASSSEDIRLTKNVNVMKEE